MQNLIALRSKSNLISGGIRSLAAAAFMIRDGGVPGENTSTLEAMSVLGGSLDRAGDPEHGYAMRGGRMLTAENYECAWDLYKSILPLNHLGKSVVDETVEFNAKHVSSATPCRRRY